MLKGKNAIITGTNRGIGKAILQDFAKNGANVFAHARKETTEFVNFTQKLSKTYNVKVTPIYFDVSDFDSMKLVIKDILKSKIKVDILVNNAAISHGGFFAMTPISKIKEIFEINLFAQMELTQLILKAMMRQKSGSIINISSVSGYDLKPGNSAYGVSKAAVIAWTKTLAYECGSYGIRVNAVAPGLIDTDMFNCMEEKARKDVISSSSMKRLGSSEEIAQVVSFLASDQSSFINGQVIRVDGGIM